MPEPGLARLPFACPLFFMVWLCVPVWPATFMLKGFSSITYHLPIHHLDKINRYLDRGDKSATEHFRIVIKIASYPPS